MRLSFFALTAMLVWVLNACSDRVSPLEPGSAAAAKASAAGPPVPVSFTDTIEGFCDFAIQVEASEKDKFIDLPGDRILAIFPGAVWILTNLSSGNEETLRIPGSFHITTLANGNVETVFTGRNLLGLTEPRFLVLSIGTFSWVFSPEGVLVQPLEGSGQLIDVCELLG